MKMTHQEGFLKAMDDGLDQFNRQDKLKLTDNVPHDMKSSEGIQDRCHKTQPKIMYTYF